MEMESSYAARLESLRALIQRANAIIVLDGAGISTASGLKDFRSPDSVEETLKTYGTGPEELLSRDFFFRETERFYRYYKEALLREVEPNEAHYALARLEAAGKLLSVCTQNIDGLHKKAGCKRVLELHGTVHENRCLNCGKYFDADAIRKSEGVPHCDCGGLIKPEVTLYDECLDEYVLRTARARMGAADLLLIIGTSLSVYPAAELPQYFRGKNWVVINRTPTWADRGASILFREEIAEVLRDAVPAEHS